MEVEYIDHMGSDLRVVDAARVSFKKRSDWDKSDFNANKANNYKLFEKDKKLINYLAEHSHWTPFSHVMVTIKEKVPIFVARQRFKHMVGFAYNEVSRRYVDDEPEFFKPDSWRIRPDNIKQGSVDESITDLILDERVVWDDPESPWLETDIDSWVEGLYDMSRQLYKTMVNSKNNVAPELARMVLPQSMYTEYFVTGSLAAWARAYKQRIDSHAQKEIQELAKEWNKIIEPLFPVSWAALIKEN